MPCRNCGVELLPDKRFCHVCGAAVTLTCPNCQATIAAEYRFCPDCGYEIAVDFDPSPPATDDTLVRLSSNMPEAMAKKILDCRGVIEGERKQVTVMFCDLAGSTAVAGTLDPEEYHELLEQYLALAFHEIYRFEGIVNQLAGDGLMALFGAPIGHEDAPQRAVWAAVAIREALAHFNRRLEVERDLTLPVRIGIHTGPVVVGTVGNDLKMDYTAIGDTTNLAARLEAVAAVGTVLISETTARLVRGFFRTRAVAPLAVKGKSEPITAHEVLDAVEAVSPMAVAVARGLTPLVGRTEELAQLMACFRRLAGNLAQVVTVVGDTGSGKSRLLHEFKQQLGEAVTFLEARCSALNRLEAYFPFVTILQRYFELTAEDSPQTAAEKIARKVGAPPDMLGAEFPVLFRLLSLPTDGRGELPPEQLKREIFRAMANLLTHETQQRSVVVVIEDLHWVDEPSQELLELAVSRLARAPILVVASHRPDYQLPWRTAAALTRLTLRPLGTGEITEIVRSLTGGPLPAELEQRILEKAEGSPFFAEEITRSLTEEGHLTRGDSEPGRLTRPVEEIRIPGTVQEVLAARLDRLRPSAKRVSQVAAVFGRQFSRRHLEELLAPEDIEIERELAELEARGVIHRESLFSDDQYRFGESLTQEVAYESLLLKQRRQLHERIGLLLERRVGEGPIERPSLIARHFALSDNQEKAVETLLRAAEEAERMPSYRTAMDLYRHAWEVGDAVLRENDTEQRRRWLVDATRGFCRMAVLYGSDDPEAERAAERGHELAEALGDTESVAVFYAFQGMVLSADPERFEKGLTLIEKAVTAAEQIGSQVQVVNISRALAWNYLLDGRFQLAQEKSAWVVEELERLEQRDQLSDLYLGSRWLQDSVRFHSGDLPEALRMATETLQLSEQASNRTIESSATSLLASLHFLRGEYAEARRWAERSLQTAEAIGSAPALHRAVAVGLAARAELGETLPLPRHVEQIEEAVPKGGAMLLNILPVVESFLLLGDVKRAEHLARTAHERAAGRLPALLSMIALGTVALQLGRGHWTDAGRWYERALSMAETLGARSSLAVAAIGLGNLALARGERDTATSHLERGLAICRDLGLGRYQRRAEELLSTPEP